LPPTHSDFKLNLMSAGRQHTRSALHLHVADSTSGIRGSLLQTSSVQLAARSRAFEPTSCEPELAFHQQN
jgi:hypothetical protein